MLSSRRHARGFSIYELMTVLAIIAITLGWAFPSFLEAMRVNRLASRTNEFITGINLARAEAVRRGNNVVICASTNRTSCGGNWDSGWIIWTDPDANAIIADVNNDIFRVVGTQDGLTATAATSMRSITFNSRGIAVGLPVTAANRIISISPTNGCPAGRDFVRNLRVTTTGQVGVNKANCP